MEVLTAEHMGFCYGVRRAVEMAAAAPGQTGAPVFTLGPLIHNPQMIEKLRTQGVGVVDELAAAGEATVVIRSHGVGPAVYAEAERQGKVLLDATCPHVKKAQLAARAFAEKGLPASVRNQPNKSKNTKKRWIGTDFFSSFPDRDPYYVIHSNTIGIILTERSSECNRRSISHIA